MYKIRVHSASAPNLYRRARSNKLVGNVSIHRGRVLVPFLTTFHRLVSTRLSVRVNQLDGVRESFPAKEFPSIIIPRNCLRLCRGKTGLVNGRRKGMQRRREVEEAGRIEQRETYAREYKHLITRQARTSAARCVTKRPQTAVARKDF